MHKHEKLIIALGGVTALGKVMGTKSPQVVDRWRRKGIPVKYWPTIVRLCNEREIKVPKEIQDFFQ